MLKVMLNEKKRANKKYTPYYFTYRKFWKLQINVS